MTEESWKFKNPLLICDKLIHETEVKTERKKKLDERYRIYRSRRIRYLTKLAMEGKLKREK